MKFMNIITINAEYSTNFNGWNVSCDDLSREQIGKIEDFLIDFSYPLCDDEGRFMYDEFDEQQIEEINLFIDQVVNRDFGLNIEYDNVSS